MAVSSSVTADEIHTHAPVTVFSRPVIERLPVRVVSPVDVVALPERDLLVADGIGECIFRLRRDGEVELAASDLENISRIAVGQQGSIVALLSGKASSQIVRVTTQGFVSDGVTLPFSAVGLVVDQIDSVYTANSTTGEVFTIYADGTQQQLAVLSEPIIDLTPGGGNVVALLASGKVVSVALDGSTRTVGYTSANSVRLQQNSAGALIGLAADTEADVASLATVASRRDEVARFATVPVGTKAFEFDSLDNLILGNDRLRAVTKVTSRFQIACPHCGQPTMMIFSTKPAQKKKDSSVAAF